MYSRLCTVHCWIQPVSMYSTESVSVRTRCAAHRRVIGPADCTATVLFTEPVMCRWLQAYDGSKHTYRYRTGTGNDMLYAWSRRRPPPCTRWEHRGRWYTLITLIEHVSYVGRSIEAIRRTRPREPVRTLLAYRTQGKGRRRWGGGGGGCNCHHAEHTNHTLRYRV